jgi:methylated-DNA-[protein]-cysteine S-methyltransferase
MHLLYSHLDTPIGPLLLAGDARPALWAIRFAVGEQAALPEPGWIRDDAALAPARSQLEAYFAGRLRSFELELAKTGTLFQLRVWNEVERIPWGTTTSYGAIARKLGKPGAARAVGLANGANPLPIVVPCHRVIGADGGLTGFSAGLAIKRWLLAHESFAVPRQTSLFAPPPG